MSLCGKALTILALGFAIVSSGLVFTRHVVAIVGEADAERLNRAILEYVAERNPHAPLKAFQRFPEVLVAEARGSDLDHCLALAVAEVESEFQHDAVGPKGEIGLFQILVTDAARFESSLGAFRRPGSGRGARDLGDLADPRVNTRFAMAYLRDLMSRQPEPHEVLTEYNGGATGRHPGYYRKVMGTYVEVSERPELRCRFRTVPRPARLTLLWRA